MTLKKQFGYWMLAVPFLALLVGGVPRIFREAKTIPAGALESAGAILGAAAVWFILASDLIQGRKISKGLVLALALYAIWTAATLGGVK